MQLSLVTLDHYMCAPLPKEALPHLPTQPYYRRAPKVPVIRIFGCTPGGQKALVHVHGVLPYFYIRNDDNCAFDDVDTLRDLLPSIATSIENAIRVREKNSKTVGKAIARMVIVEKMPFYGYYTTKKLFIQVFLYNPSMMRTVESLFRSGLIANQIFSIYEAHIPYLLQLFADYNLAGMALIELKDFRFRPPMPRTQSHLTQLATVWTQESTPLDFISSGRQGTSTGFTGRFCPPSRITTWYSRQSTCCLELDITPECILNRSAVPSSQVVPSLALLWKEEQERNPDFKEGPSLSSDDVDLVVPECVTKGISTNKYVVNLRKALKVALDQDLSQKSQTILTPNDEEMYAILEEMGADAQDGWEDSVRGFFASQVDILSENPQDDDDAASCSDEEEEECQQSAEDECRDICVSQQEYEDKQTNAKEWWSVAEVDLSQAFNSEIGSPRLRKRKKKCEETKMETDIEDLMPPMPKMMFSDAAEQDLLPPEPNALQIVSQLSPNDTLNCWTLPTRPPSRESVLSWISNGRDTSPSKKNHSQISAPTPTQTSPACLHQRGFKLQAASSYNLKVQSSRNLTLLSVELHINTRSDLLPDPLRDRVSALFYSVYGEEGCQKNGESMVANKFCHNGVVISDPTITFDGIPPEEMKITHVKDEVALYQWLIQLVQEYDPDFLVGFEMQKSSFGYLLERATVLKINLLQQLSRIPSAKIDPRNTSDSRGARKATGIWIIGRTTLNIWRLMRKELTLNKYAFEDVYFHVFKRRLPKYSHAVLTKWFQTRGSYRWRVLRYYSLRAQVNITLLQHLDLIARTSEMAQLFGMDFFSVLTRGSQYRVECVFIRITKPHGYLMLSPSREHVAKQAATECIPLVMEPHSAVYTDPILVLDFQSLYPSIMIAYNMCYSTYLGKLGLKRHPYDLENSMGVDPTFRLASETWKDIGPNVVVSPNGVVFAPKSVRQGILPQMLNEILNTRIMVKNAMKKAFKDSDKVLHRVLDARQYALKMVSNVTYGYTGASFSGRMPCSQLADAIVETGRTTLENAIHLVESNPKWKAKVVYGDTDSIFVHLPDRTRDEAFDIGQEISDAVTASNPKPMKLKFEKVYMGSVLLTKKRYVGNKYESREDTLGVFDAKGIETVRRDTCPVVSKMMEKILKMLFQQMSTESIRCYIERQWTKILKGFVRPQDFIFAKEVKLGSYAADRGKEVSLPPAAIVSKKAMTKDLRAEPRYSERVPYVVVNGAPGSRLVDLVVSPEYLLDRAHRYTLNGHYYITKQIIPALERVMLLINVDIRHWFNDMPRPAVRAVQLETSTTTSVNTIDSYYMSKHCYLCDALGKGNLCASCLRNPQETTYALQVKYRSKQEAFYKQQAQCRACAQLNDPMLPCTSISCPKTFHKVELDREIKLIETVLKVTDGYP